MKNFLIRKVKNYIQACQNIISPLCSGSGFASSLYFTFFSRAFYYEHNAILQGQRAYKKSNGIHGDSSALLRRNIHRLEKGLIMRPRREIFALSYLLETVLVYKEIINSRRFSVNEISWAEYIFEEYFSVVDCNHPDIKNAYQTYIEICSETEKCHDAKVPYQYTKKAKHDIGYNEFIDLCLARRSIRWFENKKVEDEKIYKAVAAALQAPSACNRQPYEFFMVQSQPLLSQLAKLPGGTAGFADNIPCLIAVVGDLSYYPQARDRHVIYIDGSLASMQFMLALETLGLASCPINWPELYTLDKKVSNLLDLPQYKRVVMFIAVGYPEQSGYVAYSEKKLPRDIIKKL